MVASPATRIKGLSLAVAAIAAAATLSGCSDDKTETIAVEATEPTNGQSRLTAPASVAGGVVKINFKNSGSQPHEAQLLRVEGAHTKDEVVEAIAGGNGNVPDWLFAEGGVGTTAPGSSRSATVKVPSGQYYVVDTGTDQENNSFANNGAVASLTVTAGSGGSVPQSGARIEARDYEFTVPTLESGTQDITFDNVGNQPHLLFAAPIAPGKTVDDVKAALSAQDQPPPVDFQKATSVAAIEGTKSIATTITLDKGDYVFICFLSDRGGGPPHYTLGMVQGAKVG